MKSNILIKNLKSYPLNEEYEKLVERVIYYLDNSNKSEFMRAMNDLLSDDDFDASVELGSISEILYLGMAIYKERVKQQ